MGSSLKKICSEATEEEVYFEGSETEDSKDEVSKNAQDMKSPSEEEETDDSEAMSDHDEHKEEISSKKLEENKEKTEEGDKLKDHTDMQGTDDTQWWGDETKPLCTEDKDTTMCNEDKDIVEVEDLNKNIQESIAEEKCKDVEEANFEGIMVLNSHSLEDLVDTTI